MRSLHEDDVDSSDIPGFHTQKNLQKKDDEDAAVAGPIMLMNVVDKLTKKTLAFQVLFHMTPEEASRSQHPEEVSSFTNGVSKA